MKSRPKFHRKLHLAVAVLGLLVMLVGNAVGSREVQLSGLGVILANTIWSMIAFRRKWGTWPKLDP